MCSHHGTSTKGSENRLFAYKKEEKHHVGVDRQRLVQSRWRKKGVFLMSWRGGGGG